MAYDIFTHPLANDVNSNGATLHERAYANARMHGLSATREFVLLGPAIPVQRVLQHWEGLKWPFLLGRDLHTRAMLRDHILTDPH